MNFLFLIGAALMVWWGWYMVKRNPAAFSGENIGKSFYTLGILGLLLIVVIVICVKILN